MIKLIICTLAAVFIVHGHETNACDGIERWVQKTNKRVTSYADGRYIELNTFMPVPCPQVSYTCSSFDANFINKIVRMKLSATAAICAQFNHLDESVDGVLCNKDTFSSLYVSMARYRRDLREINTDFLRIIDWLDRFCLEKSPDISRDYLIANPTPLNEEDAYTVRKYLLDEGAFLIAGYDDAIELQRTIQALQAINEERDRTRLAELINGGWKTDDRILRILNGE